MKLNKNLRFFNPSRFEEISNSTSDFCRKMYKVKCSFKNTQMRFKHTRIFWETHNIRKTRKCDPTGMRFTHNIIKTANANTKQKQHTCNLRTHTNAINAHKKNKREEKCDLRTWWRLWDLKKNRQTCPRSISFGYPENRINLPIKAKQCDQMRQFIANTG